MPSCAELEPLAQMALAHVSEKIDRAVSSLGDPYLMRAVIGPARIKTIPEHCAPFLRTPDLVGHRLVCNNLQDVRRGGARSQSNFSGGLRSL